MNEINKPNKNSRIPVRYLIHITVLGYIITNYGEAIVDLMFYTIERLLKLF